MIKFRFTSIITMRKFFLLFCLCAGYYVHGQTNLMRTDLISPSPTAANLGKYGDIPVSYYTGLPNVSIPLFNVTGNELSLPITLTYNFNGHQPAQKAGWVGLGWSLQAGGVITRTIGDKVEETNEGYDRDSASRINPPQSYLHKSYMYSYYDNLPDIYSFNFGNYSGKFILYDGEAHVMPDQKLKITGSPGGFTIIAEDGIKYEFTEAEETSPRPTAGATYTLPTYNSAWYLTKITNAANTESIRLFYTPEGGMLQFGLKSQSYYKKMGTFETPSIPQPPNDVFPTRVSVKRLTQIVSDKYTVWMDPGPARQDIEMMSGSANSLARIRVVSSEGSLVKRIDFEYDYFGSGAIHYKYLKLKSLTDRGTTINGEYMKHRFDYHNEQSTFGTGVLSYVDKFGYLKGGGFMPGDLYISNEIYPGGANREPIPSAAVNGVLKKITYPTGGNTTFSYEGSRAFNGQKYLSFAKNALGQADRGYPATTNILYGSDTFRITQAQRVLVRYGRTPKIPWDPTNPDSPPDVRHDNLAEVEIAQVSAAESGPDGLEEVVGQPFWTGRIVFNADNGGKEEFVEMEPGKYRIRAVCDKDELQAFGVIEYIFHSNIPDPGIAAPGVRLTELNHDNGFGTTTKKKFSYLDPLGFQTGRLLQSNAYDAHEYKVVTMDFSNVKSTTNYIQYTSVLAETQGIGLPFYHNKVREETTSSTNSETHRTDYSFEYFHGTQKVELTKRIDYLKSGNNFIPQVMEENTFSPEIATEGFAGMGIFVKTRYQQYDVPDLFGNEYDFDSRVYSVAWKHPLLTRKTQYENGQALVTEMRSYYDANDNRNLVGIRKIMSDGTSLYTKYKYPEDYSHAVPTISGLVNAHMLSSVIEEQVWKKDRAGDSVMIRGRINVYGNRLLKEIYFLESAQGITAPNLEPAGGLYTVLISDDRYKKKIEFRHDASGRMISQQLTDEEPVAYLWGYNPVTVSGSAGKIYPIAEIKNAAPEDVFHTSFEDGSGTPMATVTGLYAYNGEFTIPGNYTGSYTLTYWQKTGSGPWELVQEPLTDPSGKVIGNANSSIDEVRLYPSQSLMTTYTYRSGLGISTVNDPNNSVSYYEYDLAGRLKTIRDKSMGILKTFTYHVKDEVAGTTGVE
jgi:hypothetical protein